MGVREVLRSAKRSRRRSRAMSSAELLPSTAAASSTTVSIDETLYRTVLARWKRCHAEGALLAAELRRVEANRRAETLFRLLTIQQSNALQACMRRWALQVSLLRELELEERCRALALLESLLGELPFLAEAADAEVAAPQPRVEGRPAVLADGSYASQVGRAWRDPVHSAPFLA